MTRPVFLRLALIGAVVAAFTLSACGRKGPLDPPPRATATAAAAAQPADPNEVTEDSDGNPVLPKGRKKSFILDGLLN